MQLYVRLVMDDGREMKKFRKHYTCFSLKRQMKNHCRESWMLIIFLVVLSWCFLLEIMQCQNLCCCPPFNRSCHLWYTIFVINLSWARVYVVCHSGHRIGTAEVESALVSHPLCAEAAVVGVEHEVKPLHVWLYKIQLILDKHCD